MKREFCYKGDEKAPGISLPTLTTIALAESVCCIYFRCFQSPSRALRGEWLLLLCLPPSLQAPPLPAEVISSEFKVLTPFLPLYFSFPFSEPDIKD